MLDVNTPKGQQTVRDELVAANMLERAFVGWKYLHTPKKGDNAKGDVDAVIAIDNRVMAVASCSCRYDFTLEEFYARHRGDWLLTKWKLDKGQRVADALQVPFYGMLYVVRDLTLLAQRLYAPGRGWLVQIDSQRTRTQATVNGGTAVRENSYIDMRGATVIKNVN